MLDLRLDQRNNLGAFPIALARFPAERPAASSTLCLWTTTEISTIHDNNTRDINEAFELV